MQSTADVTELLNGWRAGDGDARNQLMRLLHPQIAQIAAARMRHERNMSLSTGDLINDAMVRLLRIERIELDGRAHFLALASRLMRTVLIDHARAKGADKRRHAKVELCTNIDGEQRFDLNALDSALLRLGAIDAQLMELVEMRYFGGMSIADVAVVTGLSEATVKRRWQTARAWLTDALANPITL
jgi:RNA polymerase sigma factor (TIGR02999 family)